MKKIIKFFKNIQEAPYEVRKFYHLVFFGIFGFLFLIISLNLIAAQIKFAAESGEKYVKETLNESNMSPLQSIKQDVRAIKDSVASLFSVFKESEKEVGDYFKVLNKEDIDNLNQEGNQNEIKTENVSNEKTERLPVEEY